MKFKQTSKEFFRSKTNWTGLTMILSAISGFLTQTLGAAEAWQMVTAGLGIIFIKDAVVGVKQTPP